MLKWRSIQLLACAVSIAPRVCVRIAPFAGDLVFLLAARRRAVVRRNVATIMPRASTDTIAGVSRGIFRSVARTYVDLLALPRYDARALDARTVVHGYDHFLQALALGRGVIIAGGHIGPAELILQAFAGRGIHYTAMVERIEPPQLSQLLRRVRQAHGHRYVDAGLAGTKALVRTLRASGVVAILVDRDVLGSGIAVSFLGTTALVPSGAVELSRLTGAPIVPAYSWWRADGRHEAVLGAPLHPGGRSRDPAALRTEVERLLEQLEPAYRRRPEQWLLLQPLSATAAGGGRQSRYTGTCDG